MVCFLLKNLVHYGLHFLFPIVIAYIFYRSHWKKASLILLFTMLVDIDHVFATPIFDPSRNSIGFHYLHTLPAIAVYAVVFIFGKGNWRLIALGLLLHMATDYQDSLWFC